MTCLVVFGEDRPSDSAPVTPHQACSWAVRKYISSDLLWNARAEDSVTELDDQRERPVIKVLEGAVLQKYTRDNAGILSAELAHPLP
ncbi:hypothetical protein Q1695_003154 [Nippostrongylus brasiliensis]|nr:hypothetical protein Q1695_003154 [Nippostrongylus brasiliensis]